MNYFQLLTRLVTNGIWTRNHFVRKRTLNKSVKADLVGPSHKLQAQIEPMDPSITSLINWEKFSSFELEILTNIDISQKSRKLIE